MNKPLEHMSTEELEQFAKNEFSGYGGADHEDIASYEEQDLSSYESQGEDWINYGDPKMGIQTLFHPKKSKTIFKFTITNGDTDNTKNAILGAPDYKQGRILEGSFKSTDGSDVFTASGKRKSIDDFNSIIRDEPGLVSQMDLRCSDTTQFEETFTHFTRAFSKNDDEEFIDPQDYESKNQFNANFIEVQRPFVLGPDNWLDIPVISNQTLTVTLFFTALGNRSASFMRKVQRMIQAYQ